MTQEQDYFADSAAYDRAMGRMSRVAGEKFIDWLSLPGGLRWLDVGCGTGSFAALLPDRTAARAISAIDPSGTQIAYAKSRPGAERIDYRPGDALALPFRDGEFDVAVMALVIQYVPDRAKAMSEMVRVVRPGGTVAAYVWPGGNDGHPMQFLRKAMKAAGIPRNSRPGTRIRTIDGLVELYRAAGLEQIECEPIDIRPEFMDFDDFWASQTAATLAGLTDKEIGRLRAALRESAPTAEHGRIAYGARVNAIRAQVPG